MNTKYTEEQANYMIKRYKEGVGSSTIAKELGLKIGTVTRYIDKTIGLRSSKQAGKLTKSKCDENYFEKIDTPEKAYWLGFIMADGYVLHNQYSYYLGISLAEKDKEHLERFKKAIQSESKIHTYKTTSGYSPDTIYCRILINSEKLYKDLVSQGVVEHKTNILEPPDIKEEFVSHFIRGYFDGDGCLTKSQKKNKNYFDYTVKIVSTEKVLDFIKSFIEKNNIAKIHQYYKRKKEQIVSSLELGGNKQVKKFLNLMYKDSTIHLNRKYNRYLELINM